MVSSQSLLLAELNFDSDYASSVGLVLQSPHVLQISLLIEGQPLSLTSWMETLFSYLKGKRKLWSVSDKDALEKDCHCLSFLSIDVKLWYYYTVFWWIRWTRLLWWRFPQRFTLGVIYNARAQIFLFGCLWLFLDLCLLLRGLHRCYWNSII